MTGTDAIRRSRRIRCLWAACLLLAALNHAHILYRHGLFWDYGGVGAASAIYWSGLTIMDPVVAMLLFVRPRVGIPATVFLITTNVVHNLAITARHTPDAAAWMRLIATPVLMGQLGFLLVVALTARAAWTGAPVRRQS